MDMAEPTDHHRYAGVLLYPDTVKFFIAAVQFYESLLRRDLSAIASDADLKLFLSDEETERFPIHDELARAQRVREWLDGLIKQESRCE